MATQAYENTLEQLAALLRRKSMTAAQVAEELGCCRPAVYSRIRALQERGVNVVATEERAPHRTGPRASRFRIT